jgi:Tfp pilus assembly ATPase PilU
MAAIDITPVLKFMTDKSGSDLFFSTNTSIHMDIEGETVSINNQIMQPGMIKEIAYSMMSMDQIKEFESTLESNFAIEKKEYIHIPIIILFPSIYTGYHLYDNKEKIIRWVNHIKKN